MEFKGDLPQFYAAAVDGDISYLFMRDLPELIKKYVITGNKALDYGCGTGLRMPFLKEQGFDVEGVDIEPDMLKLSEEIHSEFPVTLIQSGEIPKDDNTYDLVFMCYVLLMIKTIPEMYQVMTDIYRVLKPGGVFIGITAAEYMYNESREWLFLETGKVVSPPLVSGGTFRIKFTDSSFYLDDIYWSDADYCSVFREADFLLEKCHQPLGDKDDRFDWKDELKYPCSSIYILRKPYDE